MVPLADRGLRTGIIRREHQSCDQNSKRHNASADGRGNSRGSTVETAGRHDPKNELIQVY